MKMNNPNYRESWKCIENLEKIIYSKINKETTSLIKKQTDYNNFNIFYETEFLGSLKKELSNYFNNDNENPVDVTFCTLEKEKIQFFLQFQDNKNIRLYIIYIIFNQIESYPAILLMPFSIKEFIYYNIRAIRDLKLKDNKINTCNIQPYDIQPYTEKIYNEIDTEDIRKILLSLNLKYNMDIRAKIF